MTEDEQRIAIAECCGITEEMLQRWMDHEEAERRFQCAETHEEGYYRRRLQLEPVPMLPNYLHDLNAMHEAEKVLNEWQQENYGAKIYTGKPNVGAIQDFCTGRMVFTFMHASAAQRAEAFLRTVGKWKD